MTNAFSYSCEGESHKATQKVGQDYSLTSSVDDLTVAIVCDGHGGERYFRSDKGSMYAAEATLEAVTFLVEQVGDSLFVGKPYTAVGPTDTLKDGQRLSKEDTAFRQLFSSIIYRWNEKIKQHAKTHELTEWEKKNVPPKYLEEFEKSETFEKQYGCTLMVYVQTKRYWFAFHIGDGKCLSFQKDPIWNEPIPWDEKCFLNKTTSLCDTSAIEEFRYCYQGDGNFPIAVVLGSDGLDDSFGESSNLANFYIQILKMLANEGIEATKQSLEETLPKLSKIGSKDDMSVACVFDIEEVKNNIHIFIRYQLDLVKEKLYAIEQRIENLRKRRDSLVTLKDNKSQIEFKYALQDIEKAIMERKNLARKYDLIAAELPEGSVPPYCIEEENIDIVIQQQEQIQEEHQEEDNKPEENLEDSSLPDSENNEKVIIEEKVEETEQTDSCELPETKETPNEVVNIANAPQEQ